MEFVLRVEIVKVKKGGIRMNRRMKRWVVGICVCLLVLGSVGEVLYGLEPDNNNGVTGTNNIAVTSSGYNYVGVLSIWSATNTPAAGAIATISKAAGTGLRRHVATGVTMCFQDSAINTAGRIVNLRDGATGAGTVLRSWYLSNGGVAGGAQCENVVGLNMTGTAATAMTIEFAGAPAATALETVTLTGYTTP
jgi:hypothetical protein